MTNFEISIDIHFTERAAEAMHKANVRATLSFPLAAEVTIPVAGDQVAISAAPDLLFLCIRHTLMLGKTAQRILVELDLAPADEKQD